MDKSLIKMIMYSSNPEDLVCDFFLGSFSTAKVAIGLGRKACGFELNNNAYEYQIDEIEKIKSGELLNLLREVPQNQFLNKGKPLSTKEKQEIITEFENLFQKGLSKKDSIEKISEKFGRGYWSIQKTLDNFDEKHIRLNENSLFD